MALIATRSLTIGFGDPPLLEDITFQIEKGERVGLLGRNGTGKSTLMQLLEGKILPDSGEIQRPNSLTVSSLAQNVPIGYKGTIFDVVAGGL